MSPEPNPQARSYKYNLLTDKYNLLTDKFNLVLIDAYQILNLKLNWDSKKTL